MQVLTHKYKSERITVKVNIDEITTVPSWVGRGYSCEHCQYDLEAANRNYCTVCLTTNNDLLFFHHECFEKSKKEAGEKE